MSTLGRGGVIGEYSIDREVARERTTHRIEGTHRRLGRRVAIQLMAATAPYRGTQAQFLREADVLDRLRHPGVARVYECGALPDGRAWFATDRDLGPSLAHVIASGARVDALRVLLDVSTIVAHAHAQGVSHRQLRAELVQCGVDPAGPTVRVVDWSQSRDLAAAPSDAPADVYALGVIAFQCLSGVMAFGGGPLAVGAGVSAAERFPRASRLLTALVDRMLARDLRARPSMAEVHAAALALATGHVPGRVEIEPEMTRIEMSPPLRRAAG